MKKTLCFVMALAVSLMMCVSAFAADYGSLVVLGDSIATGYGLPGYVAGDNTSAKDSFGNKLGAQSKDYANFAVDGRTTAELLTALDGAEISAKIKKADNVVVSIGGNDYLVPLATALMEAVYKDEELMGLFASGSEPTEADVKRLTEKLEPVMQNAVNSVDLNKTYNNLNGIFGKIRQLNPDCEIVTLTVYNPFEGNTNMAFFDKTSETVLAKLNTKIYAAAGINNVKVVDAYTLFKGKPTEYTNIATMDVHPNKSGHALIYSKISALLSGAAGDNTQNNPNTGSYGIVVAVGVALLCSGVAVFARKKR